MGMKLAAMVGFKMVVMGCGWGHDSIHGYIHLGFPEVPNGVWGWLVPEVEVDWHEVQS